MEELFVYSYFQSFSKGVLRCVCFSLETCCFRDPKVSSQSGFSRANNKTTATTCDHGWRQDLYGYTSTAALVTVQCSDVKSRTSWKTLYSTTFQNRMIIFYKRKQTKNVRVTKKIILCVVTISFNCCSLLFNTYLPGLMFTQTHRFTVSYTLYPR